MAYCPKYNTLYSTMLSPKIVELITHLKLSLRIMCILTFFKYTASFPISSAKSPFTNLILQPSFEQFLKSNFIEYSRN